MNHSFDIYPLPPEPDLSDYKDLQRWTKWFAWDRKRERACWARTRTTPDGHVEWTEWWAFNRRYWAGA